VVLATGATWRRDLYGRTHHFPELAIAANPAVFTPDDVMDGGFAARAPEGPVVVYDDDGFYLSSLVAEAVRALGRDVLLVTPDDSIAPWSANTLDYRHIQWRLHERGIATLPSHGVAAFDHGVLRLEHAWTGAGRDVHCAALVVLTARLPNDALLLALREREAEWADAGVRTVRAIGDCEAPGLIAHAVYAGHRYARELDAPPAGDAVPFRRHFHTATS
jgi:dimethylamine/trimethylamine dehydrogenase